MAVDTLDQSCEALSRRNHLLHMDTLNGSKYNSRVDEVKAAVYVLQEYARVE